MKVLINNHILIELSVGKLPLAEVLVKANGKVLELDVAKPLYTDTTDGEAPSERSWLWWLSSVETVEIWVPARGMLPTLPTNLYSSQLSNINHQKHATHLPEIREPERVSA